MEEHIDFKGASFLVEIKSQKHHTWQGRVTWVEENKIKAFRSMLELIKMIDSALPQEEHEEEQSM